MSDSDVTSDCSSPSHLADRSDSGSDDDSQEGQSNSSESETPTDSPSEEENRQSGSSSPEPETSSDTFADVKYGVGLSWSSMVIGGLNVNSLLGGKGGKGKKASVANLISKHDLDILVIGESKLSKLSKLSKKTATKNQNNDPLHIVDFTYVRQDRTYTNSAHGGLIVYIKEGIEYKTKSHWEWHANNVQFLEISITEPTRFDLVAIYSPQKEHVKYVTDLMKFFLERNKKLNTPVMFVGDLNLDPIRDTKAKQAFEQFSKEFSTRLLITDETSEAGYCIDHIITNIPEELMLPVTPNVVKTIGIIADHNLVLCRVKNEILCISQPTNNLPGPPQPGSGKIAQYWASKCIKEGETKVLITSFYEFSEPIRTVDVQLPSGAKDDQYQFVRMQNLKMESVEPVQKPEIFRQDKWLHSKLSEDGKEVSVCVEFDSEVSVCERECATDGFLKTLSANNSSIGSAGYTVVVLYRKPLPLGKYMREIDQNCWFFLKCTMEQLTSGDKSLHNLLKKYPF